MKAPRLMRESMERRVAGAGRETGLVASTMRHPRIEDRIEKVGDEVHHDQHERDEHERALRQRIVRAGHRVHQQAARARAS